MELLVYRPGVGLISLGEGPITLSDGEILLVSVTFHYTCNEDSQAKLRLSIGRGGEDFEWIYYNDTDVDLEAAPAGRSKSAVLSIEVKTSITNVFPIGPRLEAGTYDLKAEIVGYPDTYDLGIGMLTVHVSPGIVDTISSMISMMVMLMIMGMIMPMMSGIGESSPSGSEGGVA